MVPPIRFERTTFPLGGGFSYEQWRVLRGALCLVCAKSTGYVAVPETPPPYSTAHGPTRRSFPDGRAGHLPRLPQTVLHDGSGGHHLLPLRPSSIHAPQPMDADEVHLCA